MLGATVLVGGFLLVAAPPAQAADSTVAYAQGQFLSGSLAGVELDAVASLAPAEASNDGSTPLVTSKDPLSATALRTVTVEAEGSIQTDLGSVLDAGAINQYAEAASDGYSMGASGAIGDDGAIGVGSVGSGAAGDLTLDLTSAISGQYASLLADLRLSLDAVSAQAVAELSEASGDYRIAGATLNFTSPAIANLGSKVTSALNVVDAQLLELGADNGVLGLAVSDVLDPVLGVVGSSANVDVSISSDLHGAVQSLLGGVYGDGAVSFNLHTGEVSVDLEALRGGNLNNLPPSTELISGVVLGELLAGITATISTLADQIVERAEAALRDATVDVRANLDLLTAQQPLESTLCTDVQVPIIGDILTGGIVGGLLDGLGATVTQGIIGYTTQRVCDIVQTVLPDLRSTVDVHVNGSVDGLINGTAATANASVSLLDGTVQTAVNVDAIIGGIGDGLLSGLFGSGGAVSDLVDALNLHLISPAQTGLIGGGGVAGILDDVLSVKANAQKSSGGMFTQTAVQVSVLGELATLSVASATVGPNVTGVGCTVNCGPGGGDPEPCVTNCSGGGTTPTGSTSGGGFLGMTGLSIGMLVALVVALLAAGLYLARKGYLQNHPQAVGSGADE